MIPRETIEWLSPLLGSVGGIALAYPFFDDWRARRKRKKRMSKLTSASMSAENRELMRAEIANSEFERVLSADPWTALCALLGCLLLVGSFAIFFLADPVHPCATSLTEQCK